MLKYITKILLPISILAVVGCSEEPSETINGLNSLTILTNEAPGDNCANGGVQIAVGQDANGNGELDQNEISSISFVCNGSSETNSSLLIRTTEEPAGENCENGGSLIELGSDQNGDGELEDSEVQSSFYVCNGLDGADGNGGGIDGLTSLIVATPSTACDGITIQIGLDQNNDQTLDPDEIQSTYNICNGADGNHSLIECTVESAGKNCPNGGITIEIGIDSNGNGILDSEEKIGEPKYICNGVDGIDGRSLIVTMHTDVTGCSNGGVELTFGYDNNTDGLIDDILQTVQICNGNDGLNGSDGNDGLNTIIETITDPAECTNGGLEIRIGLDRNRDGDIDETGGDDNELISTETICNGIDGSNGNDGREIIMTSVSASCGGDGGQTYSFGYDDDNNGVIDELLTSFTICNGSDGSNGADGNSDGIFEFYISKGFNGYEETVDVSINEQGNDEYGQILSVDFADADRSNSILYFPRIQELVEDGTGGDSYEIVEAILYLRAAVPADPRTPPSNENWIGVKTLRSNAPIVQDGSATWFTADGSGDMWSSPGADVSEDGGANDFSDMYSLPAFITFDGVVPLLLNRSEITHWTADESLNTGMVVTFAGNQAYELDFYSSEYETDIYFRPTLYIKVQTNTKARLETHEAYKERWNLKSYEEKIEPLIRRKRDLN